MSSQGDSFQGDRSQGDSFKGDCSRGDLAQEDSSPYFKKPNNISTTSTRVSSSSVAASVYGKSAFFGNQTASNPSTPGPNRSRTSAENKSLTYTSNDRTLAGNKSSPYSSSTSLAKYGSSSNSLASYGSTSTVSDFNINKRKGRNSFDTSSLATPGKVTLPIPCRTATKNFGLTRPPPWRPRHWRATAAAAVFYSAKSK